MSRTHRSCGLALGVALWMVVAGCDRSGLNLAPVEGVVTYKGSPLQGAAILFRPESGPFATGTTDANGRFILKTANHEGALVGDHKVIITKTETIVKQIPGERLPRYDTKYLIPPKYSDVANSGLGKTVVDDDNVFEFNLD
jgi:hypothetical protein